MEELGNQASTLARYLVWPARVDDQTFTAFTVAEGRAPPPSKLFLISKQTDRPIASFVPYMFSAHGRLGSQSLVDDCDRWVREQAMCVAEGIEHEEVNHFAKVVVRHLQGLNRPAKRNKKPPLLYEPLHSRGFRVRASSAVTHGLATCPQV